MIALKTPPAALPLTQESVFDHLRLILEEIPGSPPQALPVDHEHVRLLTEAAVSEMDGANGLLGIALITQTWVKLLDGFPSVIELPVPPLRQVVEIKYLDAAGVEQTLSPSDYRVNGVGSIDRALIRPHLPWPATKAVPECVSIEFKCGFGDTSEDVPAAIRGALLEIIGTRYRYRETVSASTGFAKLPDSATAALNAYRDWSFG
jgi:uncharacterized phiE125 gp8 family phage protein